MDVDLPYLSEDIDRHGNARLYARKKVNGRFKKVRLHAAPGSPKFMDEYQAALASFQSAAKSQEKSQHVGTMGWLAEQWYKSPQFAVIDKREQRVRQLVMFALLKEETKAGSGLRFYDCPVAEFNAQHVRVLRDRRKDAPSVANKRVAELHKLFAWGVEERPTWVNSNPVRDVKKLPYESDGFEAWTTEDVIKFEEKWPVGSTPRLALAIMLFAGVRRSDVVRLGPPMVKDGSITFMPQKTRKLKKELTLPILPPLQTVIDNTTIGITTWLVTSRGKPFTAAGFGNWFRDKCDEAGLPKGRSAHGVRKIAAQTSAENGATEKEMMDIFGWTKADLAAYYARKANQKKIAANAMHKLLPNGQ